ncbi:MAG: hypothetical protein ABIV51_09315 [Saprospiraceae bacterium]
MEHGLDSIEKICRNLGGIRELYIIPFRNIQLPERNGLVDLPDNVAMPDASQFYRIHFSKSTCQFEEDEIVNNRAGDYFSYTVSFFAPKGRQKVTNLVNKLKNQRCHLVYKDANDEDRIILGARCKVKYGTGLKLPNRNGYQFTFSGTSEYPAIHLDFDTQIEVPGACDGALIALDGATLVNIEGVCLIEL